MNNEPFVNEKPPEPSTRESNLIIALGFSVALFCWIIATVTNFYINERVRSITVLGPDETVFGDGSRAVEITPSAALALRESAVLEDLRVTVLETGEVIETQSLPITARNYMYWMVKFRAENASSDVKFVNPSVDSQIQYLDGDYYTWDGAWHTIDPRLRQGTIELLPGEQLEGILIYDVPRGATELFWVYEARGHSNYVVFRVR